MGFELTGPESWRLWNVALRFLRWSRAEDAEELASETVTRMLQNVANGEQIGNGDSYVRQIARNVLHEERRRRQRELRAQQAPWAASARDSAEAARAEALFRCLEKCQKESLSPRERSLIQKYYSAEAAEQRARRSRLAADLKMSENALRLTAFRIRQKLFNRMAEVLAQAGHEINRETDHLSEGRGPVGL